MLKKNPDIIPRSALPSSVFFLLNFSNFKLAKTQWLFYALDEVGYNVSFILLKSSYLAKNK